MDPGFYSFNSYEETMEKFRNFNDAHSFRWRKTQQQGRMVLDRHSVPAFLKTKRNLSWFSRGRKSKGVTLKYDGVPYVIAGREFYTCHQGPDVDKLQKAKRKLREEQRAQQDPTFSIKRRSHIPVTKKKDCPATVEILYIIKLLDFEIPTNSRWFRTQAAQKFHLDLEYSELDKIGEWNLMHQYHIQLPTKHEHRNHPVVKLPSQQHRFASSVKTSKSSYLENADCDPPESLLNEECMGHISGVRSSEWLLGNTDLSHMLADASNDDRNTFQALRDKYSNWITDKDKFFFRESCQIEGVQKTFLLAYQSHWQNRLLSMYGEEVCFIDAGHRHCRFPLPTYFLRVKANLCHVLVGFFICETDDAALIQEALSLLRSWNEQWRPRTVLLDYELLQMNAIEAVFQEASVYLSDFHRETAWSSWFSQNLGGSTEFKNEVLKLVRAIARSTTSAGYETAKKQLQQSKWWSECPALRNYYATNWETIENKWAAAFRNESMNILSISRVGSERENGWLGNTDIAESCKNDVAQLVNVLINEVVTKSYKNYIELNIRSSERYKNYRESVPDFLRGRPKYLINHVLKRLPTGAMEDFQLSQESSRHFETFTSSGHRESVFLGEENDLPFCSCVDWCRTRLPCKHILRVLLKIPGYCWESLCSRYRESPYLKLDEELFISDDGALECRESLEEMTDLRSLALAVNDTPSVVSGNAPDGDYVITILPKRERSSSLRDNVVAKWKLILDEIHSLGEEKLEKLDDHFNDVLAYVQGNTL